jgi:hypothetical protein
MRYKTVIGRRLHARTLPTQKAEAAGCKVINIMTHLSIAHQIPAAGQQGRSPDPAAPAAFIVSYHWDETAFAV